MNPATLHTSRMRLDPLTEADRDALHRLMAFEPVRRYLFDGESVPLEVVDGWIADSDARFAASSAGLWAARFKDDDALIGLTGFAEFYDPPVLELIFALNPSGWGKGLATEMANAVIQHGFMRLGMTSIRASTDAPNTASLRTLEQLGMSEVSRDDDSHPLWTQIHFELFVSTRQESSELESASSTSAAPQWL